MEIRMLRTITFDNSLDDLFRRVEPEAITAEDIRSILEKEGEDGKPVVLIVAGTREGRQPVDYILREARRLLIYKSKVFLEAEEKRQREEKKAAVQAARAFRVDEIKARLRVERKADEEGFDRRFNAQSGEQAAVVEREIEERAAVILDEEEN